MNFEMVKMEELIYWAFNFWKKKPGKSQRNKQLRKLTHAKSHIRSRTVLIPVNNK